jgi:hypothetical protein
MEGAERDWERMNTGGSTAVGIRNQVLENQVIRGGHYAHCRFVRCRIIGPVKPIEVGDVEPHDHSEDRSTPSDPVGGELRTGSDDNRSAVSVVPPFVSFVPLP